MWLGRNLESNCFKNFIQYKFYNVVFDETTDISKILQISILIRYLDSGNIIREDILRFIDCHKNNYDNFTEKPILTGEILVKHLFNF